MHSKGRGIGISAANLQQARCAAQNHHGCLKNRVFFTEGYLFHGNSALFLFFFFFLFKILFVFCFYVHLLARTWQPRNCEVQWVLPFPQYLLSLWKENV